MEEQDQEVRIEAQPEAEPAPVQEEVVEPVAPVEPETPTEEGENIDFKRQYDELLAQEKPSELEKAKKSLYYNAERLRELGGDPAEIIAPDIRTERAAPAVTEVSQEIDKRFAERDARALAKSEDEFRVIMWYVNNRKLSVQDAHLLANKGRLTQFSSEQRRAANTQYARGSGAGRKVEEPDIPERSPEEVKVLTSRGMRWNGKTKTYQGKFYEEYWDGSKWTSRKLRK